MKTKYILVLSFIFILSFFSELTSAEIITPEIVTIENCTGTIMVHSYPNVRGKWCGNGLTGEFTTDVNGTATINSLCAGSYSICVFSQDFGTISTDIIFSNSFYDCYLSGGNNDGHVCPCGQ